MVKIFDHVKKILNMVKKIELPDGLGKSKPFSTASTNYLQVVTYFCKKLCSNKLEKKNYLLLRSFLRIEKNGWSLKYLTTTVPNSY